MKKNTYVINHAKKTITLTKKYAKLANTPGTNEFRELADIYKVYSNYTIVMRTVTPNEDKRKHTGLTIERFIFIYLCSAIADGWKLSFHYFTYDLQKNKRYYKHGEDYIVSPYALIWNDDNYYLLAYHAGTMKHFRVDKMDDIKIVKERREGVEAFKALKLSERSLKVFSMYGGTEETITLRFSNNLIGVVIDRFGRDIRISPDDDRYFKITVKVEVSPQFYGWLCGLGTGVRIIHPDEVAQKMGEYVRSIAKMY